MSIERILLETDHAVITYVDEVKDYSSIRMLYSRLKSNQKNILLGGYFKDMIAGVKEWEEHNENALVILSKDVRYPDSNATIKSLLYLPTLTLIEGEQEQLQECYKMFFASNDLEAKPKVKKITLQNGSFYE